MAFGFDYCYWSVDPEDTKYASQEVVFQDLGTSVLSGAFKGYNICLFAYGQTGSGKTYTMMGTPASIGLTPRICKGLFSRDDDYSKQPASCRVEVSFLEIYNERVRDLLRLSNNKKPYTLRVREHPETGPYVQGLSQHVVTDYKQVVGLLEEGIANRITAATHVHDASSRSHAIFTIQYTQAILENNLPSEIASKINLVDLAGSERADPSYCKDRITEGANINKSLVTLGIVISALAQNSQMFSSCQSINSIASEVDSNHTDTHCGASVGNHRRQAYIPYRDSILTWLLKDSLGGNSKTIMIATISPASSCYNETISTLRYASNAKNIINKPRVNEDANVKLIRELREEIDRLKTMLMSFELRNSSPSWSDDKDGNLTELVLQNELKIEQLTKDWTNKWTNRKAIMEEYSVDINKKKSGVMIDSNLPHLMAMDDDILSTGVVLYHLREGSTKIGRSDSKQEQDIVLQGQWIERDHCVIDNQHGIVTLRPLQGARCIVNGYEVTDTFRLSQGALVVLGKAHKFRFNHPAEAAVLRQRRSISETSSLMSCRSLEWLDLDGDFTPFFSHSIYPAEAESREQENAVNEECQPVFHSRKIQQQQLYVEELQQQILDGQIQAEQELEHDEAAINQQIRENQQWLINEEKQLAVQQQRETAVQTDVKSYAEAGVQHILESKTGPSLTEQNKKKLVQLELLRKYSLKKAEKNLRKKKVKLHLERIVKKQKLLEAKKNLEQLEASCWISEDNGKCSQSLNQDTIVTSWDCKYPRIRSGSGLDSLQRRRNSFLNLCLPHVPSCSLFVKKDPSSELSTSAHSCSNVNPPRKSLSVEYLPRTVKEQSRRDNVHNERDASFLTQRQLTEKQPSYLGNKGEGDNNNTGVISHICKDNNKMEKLDRTRQTRSKTQNSKSCSPDHFKKKNGTEIGKQVTKGKILGDSSQHTGKHLEKNESQEVSRKVRTDFKPPRQGSLPGSSIKKLKKPAVCGKASTQHLSQTAKNVKRNSKDKQSEEQHELIKTATLVGSLNNINTHKPLCHGEKRWHSAEVLSTGIAKAAPDPLRGWQEDEDIEFSDTDSTYSVDSLSCVYANVPKEQLKDEESAGIEDTVDPEGSESDDSQMSQDSLTEKVNNIESQDEKHFSEVHQELVKFCKDDSYQPLSLLGTMCASGNNLTERSFSLDSLGDVDEVSGEDLAEESKLESLDEVPAEVFWRLQNSKTEFIKSNKQHNPEETIRRSDDFNLNASCFYLDDSTQSSCSSIYGQSVKEMKISFVEQGESLNQRPHISDENLPILSDAWLSYDLKNGKSNPIIAMPSSQDQLEFRVAELHPVNKSNFWIKKDDLRQSAAELSFVSYSKQPHRTSCEPNKIEMLFASAAPSVPLPETRKHLDTDVPGTTLSFSDSTTSISFGHVSTFSVKQDYCEVATPPKPPAQEPDKFSEGRSTNEWRQSSSCLEEASGTDNFSQEKQDLSVSSVYPEISKDQSFKITSVMSAPRTHPFQKGETYVNTNFEDCLFRTIEKGDIDNDSDSSIKDSNFEDKHTSMLSNESSGLPSVCTTQEKYEDHEHLFSKEGTSLLSDESFHLCDVSSKTKNLVYVKEEKCLGDKIHLLKHSRLNVDIGQKIKYQHLSAEEIAIDRDDSSESKSHPTKMIAFCHSGQFALPIQTSEETETVSMQENRDVLTESTLEVPSLREEEENKPQDEEWCSENHFEFQTKALMSDSHSGLKLDYPENYLSQEILLTLDAENVMGQSSEGKYYNMISFSSQETPLLACMNLVMDKSICPNVNINEENTEPSIGSCDLDNKSVSQTDPNMYYQDTTRVEKHTEKLQDCMIVKDVCETRSCYMDNNLKESCSSVTNSGCVSTTDQKHTTHKEVNDSLIFDSTVHSGRTRAQHISLPASREEKEAPNLCMVLNKNDCSGVELNSGCIRNHTEKVTASGVVSAIASQEQSPCVNKESEYLEERIVTGAVTTSEDNKDEYNSKTINSEELTKLINSVNKLENDILEMKSSPSKSSQNYLRDEAQNKTALSKSNSESYSVIQRPSNDDEECFKKLLITVTHQERDKEKIQLKDVRKEGLHSSKSAMSHDSIIQTNNVNENNVQGNTKESNYPTDIEESKVQNDAREKEEFVNTKSDGRHTDENIILLQDNPAHDIMHYDSNNHGTNIDSEITETYFIASELEKQENVLQLSETCLDTDETHEERHSVDICSCTRVINRALKDNSTDVSSGDNELITDQCGVSEELRQDNNVEHINASKCLPSSFSDNSISEHCDVNLVGNRPDVYKCVSIHSLSEEKEEVNQITPIPLATTEVLTKSTNTQNMYVLKTENEGRNFEENSECPELGGSQNQAESLPEEKCSYWVSNNDTLLSEVSEESEWLPHIFSRTIANIVNDSITVNQKDLQESRKPNQNYGITSVAVKDFPHQPAYSPLLSGINRSGESMKSDPTVASNAIKYAVPLSKSISDGVVLQYYETQMDSDLKAEILYTFNEGSKNELISDVMQNKYITFAPDVQQQDGEVKGDFIFQKTSDYMSSEKIPSEDNSHSKSCIAECYGLPAFLSVNDTQNKVIPLQKLFSSENTSQSMGGSHGEYCPSEDIQSEKELKPLNLSQKESATSGSFASENTNMFPSSIFRGNVEEIMQSLPELSSQECFNSIISPKELNSLVQYDQMKKCPEAICTEREYKRSSKIFTGELECQIETTDVLVYKTSSDLCAGHSDNSVAIIEDGVNLLGHSNQPLWENPHYGEDSSTRYNINSYISEYSASLLNSSATLSNVVLECPIDKCNADLFYLEERKVFDLPVLPVGDYAVHQQDGKSTKNTQGVVEVYQTEIQGQDSSCKCLYNQDDNVFLQPENFVERTEICLQDRSLLAHQSSEEISNDEAIPPPLCSIEDFPTCTVFKKASTLDSPRLPKGSLSSICSQFADTQQDAFLTPHLSSVFRVQESQGFCHQAVLNVPCSSSETSLSLNVSNSEIERHGILHDAVTSSCPTLTTSQIEESQCDDTVIFDQQPCASETISLSFAKENGYLPISDSESDSQRISIVDGNGLHTYTSEKSHHEMYQEPRDAVPLKKRYLEDIGKNLHHILNSSIDLQDQNTSYLNSKVDITTVPTTNTNNYSITEYKDMTSEKEFLTSEQPNLSVINDSMSSKYLSGNSSLSLQEEPELEILRNEKLVFTSHNTKSNKVGQRPSLQSHSLSAPAIIVMSNFECPSETSSKVDISVNPASKSLQELNMSVEPPSPTEDDLHRTGSFSKLKADSVVPVKHKPRFQKKSVQAQRSSTYDKRNYMERTQGSRSSEDSPVHYPIAVAHTMNNLVNSETGKHSQNISSINGCNMDTRYQMETTGGLPKDNKDAIHFSSSDINPYIRPWQQDEHCNIGWKQYVFGSASDVSSNPPPLSLDHQTVMRCSSVDNGLNSQNSPFHSHLSSYANTRILSSTISSTDDLQGWDVAREGFESTHSDESGKHYTNVSHNDLETTPENCISRSENHSKQYGNASMQVDEIVLLYPSESEVSSSKSQGLLTCERETQTEAPARHKRQKRHRRSYTDMSTRKPEASRSLQQPSSWSSVQNLSLHLSQLLHNTSELLGNLSLQTVKDNEPSEQKIIDEERTRAMMSDSCTQTTEDIGIQTDTLGSLKSKNNESQLKTEERHELMKSQEVNVIVKVVHSDSVALMKEKMSESKGKKLQSMPNIKNHIGDSPEDFSISQPNFSEAASPSLKGHKTQLNAPSALALGAPKVSPVTSPSLGSKDEESSCTVVSSPVSSIFLPPACYSQDKKPVGKIGIPETRELYCKNNLLVDRASSPILTLSASSACQQHELSKSICSFKGTVRHQKDTTNSVNRKKEEKKASDPWYNLDSRELQIDTSSQTEMDSESTTSGECKEMCKVAGNVSDQHTTKELSGKGASKQEHKFTIDTHTAIHTKRLYHSSSTLELSSHGEYLLDNHRETVPLERSFRQMRATRRARNLSGGIKYESPTGNSDSSPTKKPFRAPLNEHYRASSLNSNESPECLHGSFSPQCHQAWRNKKGCPFPVSETSDVQDDDDDDDDDDDAVSDTESECNTEILLNENTSLVKTHRLRSYSLRDLPLHNKFSNWCGVKGGPHSSLTSLTRSTGDIHSQAEKRTVNATRASEIEERFLLSERRAREIERLRRERAQVMSGIHLEMNQHPLTVELTEAKLNYGIGETDAQLKILQSGVAEDLTAVPIKQQLYERHRKSIEILRKQREERLQCFRRSRSLSPQKHLSLLQTVDTNQRELDLPSRRREYLQRLRRDVVETTRVQEPKMRIQHPSEIELLLRDYQRAREETKTEIARARDKLRERAEQEKRRIREQILCQLQKAKTKLKTLVSTSTLCTESTLSLSSGPTSGYNSSNTATYTPSVLGKQGSQTFPEDAERSRGDARGRTAIRNNHLYILEQLQKGSISEAFPMTSSSMERSNIQPTLPSSHNYCHSLIVSPSTFSVSQVKGYEDLSKHVLASATAEVMAVCSNDLRNLYNGQATAGWKYQCVERDVLVYYKAFSSSATKHGFLGAGVINKPLPTVLCMLKDPSKRHLYDKTITLAQVHKKITSSIELVYVVSDVSLCYQKQPRDFCCICVEAKEENVSILALQSVYEESMPRPCKEIVRGEILPSAWILEPDTVNGRDITKVIYMVQVDLGAPAIPTRLLSSVAKRQPLVIARLAHFLTG
ncbi:stAR-related lipid transfer protein 9 isoform X2 [Hemicordylus capensis]|nr:stAR-related lipid transfer protein 9 isoform X2 [Hemicordylus capensis]